MNSWQIAGLVAGALILVWLALGVPCSPLHVSAWWPALDRLRRRQDARSAALKE